MCIHLFLTVCPPIYVSIHPSVHPTHPQVRSQALRDKAPQKQVNQPSFPHFRSPLCGQGKGAGFLHPRAITPSFSGPGINIYSLSDRSVPWGDTAWGHCSRFQAHSGDL